MKFNLTNFRLNAIAILMFAMSMAISAQCPTGMISYWKLDESVEDATTYADEKGAHDANVEVAPTKITGIIGNARDFDGATDKVAVPSHTDFDFSSTTCFSIELWTNHTDVTFGSKNKVMIGRGDPKVTGGKWWLGAAHNTGNITFSVIQYGSVTGYSVAGPSCNDGQWHHIAGIRDTSDNTLKLYIDGVLKGTASATFTNDIKSNQKIQIGTLNYSGTGADTVKYWYEGGLDDIAIYSRALSTAEVLDHYTKGKLGSGYCEGKYPEIISEPILSAAVGQLYTYNVDATGTEPLTYALSVKPSGMTISSTGLIEWTPGSTSENSLVKVVVSNPSFPPADTQTFTINIAEAVVCPADLIGLWKLDEKSGSIFADLYGNHAEAVTAPIATTGIIDGAQTFSVTTEVNIPDDGSFEWGKDDGFTIEAWVNTLYDGSSIVAIGRRDGIAATWWLGLDANEKPSFYLKDTDGKSMTLTFDMRIHDGFWHQLVAVYDGSASLAYLYLDGLDTKIATTFTAGFTKSGGSVPVNVGWYNTSSGYHFIGEIDEIALYNRALPSTEIAGLYNNGKPEGHCKAGNYAPVIKSTAIETAMDSVEYKYQVTATDANGDDLTFGATVLPAWLSIDTVTGLLKGTPKTANIGDHNVTITVSDGIVDPAVSQSFIITVKAYSTVPEITSQSYLSTGKNTPLDLKVADFTVLDPDTDPTNMTLVVLEGTNYTFTGTTVTPAVDFIGNINVNVQVNDGSSNSVSFPALIVVGSVSVDNTKETNIKVYPNPASDYIVFEMDEVSNSTMLEIYNTSGSLVKKQILDEQTQRVELYGLTAGSYIYRIVNNMDIMNGRFQVVE